MQANFQNFKPQGYTSSVNTGRPAKKPRSKFGERLHELRENSGLSQAEVATRLDIPHRTYAHWERADVALRAEQLAALADIFDVSCDHLIGRECNRPRGKGPEGKLKKALELASSLPKRRQQRVVEFIEDILAAYEAKHP
jgi:transcriptional regulator with XRE-family HTH domain